MVVFIVLLDKTLMILSYDSEWFGNVRELGVYGTFVQRSAESELQRATMKVSDVFVDPELLGWPKRKKKKHSLLKMAPEGCETTVMLIRHCEKYNLKSHCNYVGYERAMYLATQFGHDKSNRWPAPSKIYALQVKRRHGKHKNFRELETVQEIAKKFKLPINEEFHTSDTKQLATTLLRSILQGEHCGGLILISWKHSNLPNLARKLGK